MSDCISPVAARPIPPQAPPAPAPAGWQAAFDNVMNHGTYVPSNGGIPPMLVLKSIRGPLEGTHQADYLVLWGGRDSAGRFHGSDANIVSERWDLREDGKFYIDQWLHQLQLDGSGDRPRHGYLVENDAGRVYDMGSHRIAPGEAEANLAALVAMFGQLEPPAPQAPADAMADAGERDAVRTIAPVTEKREPLEAPRAGGFSLR